jgi:hypothetical protein
MSNAGYVNEPQEEEVRSLKVGNFMQHHLELEGQSKCDMLRIPLYCR